MSHAIETLRSECRRVNFAPTGTFVVRERKDGRLEVRLMSVNGTRVLTPWIEVTDNRTRATNARDCRYPEDRPENVQTVTNSRGNTSGRSPAGDRTVAA